MIHQNKVRLHEFVCLLLFIVPLNDIHLYGDVTVTALRWTALNLKPMLGGYLLTGEGSTHVLYFFHRIRDIHTCCQLFGS